jgi:putative membrane protein
MKVTLMALTGLLAAASFCACSNNNDNSGTVNQVVNATDSVFVMQAGMGNTAEDSAAMLALTKSTDTSIVYFANKMIADHSAAQASLKNIAGRYYLSVPDVVDSVHRQLMMQMAQLSGRAFDSTYIHQQVVDHDSTIARFQREVDLGNNVDLRNFADTTLPKLQMHLDMADSIATRY